VTFSQRTRSIFTILAAVVAALLACAATASAEARSGETTGSLELGEPSAESTILHASATYETTGTVAFTVTTLEAPREESEGAANTTTIGVGFLTAPECTSAAVLFSGKQPPTPYTLIKSFYGSKEAGGVVVVEGGGEVSLPGATKTVSGATMTFSQPAADAIANQAFNCAFVEAGKNADLSAVAFPISAPPPPIPTPPNPTPPAAAPQVAAPAPAPALLSLAKSKPVTLKVGKWRTVKVTVTNAGGTATGPGSLRVKAPKGVLVKPERQQLPVLTPGGSWTVSVRVQLTEKAKKTSNLALTAAAPGVTGTGALVLKLKQ
jgi:hypothetical protein